MKTKIKQESVFTSVTIEITFESLEELQEYELRMCLYKHNLFEAARNQQYGLIDVPEFQKRTKAPIGIWDHRRELRKLLGVHSHQGRRSK